MNHNTISKPFAYILVYALIAFSGIPFFVGNRFLFPIYFILLILLFLTYNDYKKFFTPKTLKYFAFIFTIILLKGLLQNDLSFNSFSAFTIKVISPFIILALLKEKYFKYYIDTLYFISIVSLFFYFLFLFSDTTRNFFINNVCPFFHISARNTFYEYAPNFILYTIKVTNRNSGPFWEPGGFGAFLVLGLIFNYIKNRKFLNKQGIVFIISIITTLSTASYFALLILIITFNFKKNFKQLFIILPILFGAYTVFENQDFLKEKIESQWEVVQSGRYENKAPNRFSSAIIDFRTALQNPLLGVRIGTISSKFDVFDHRNNGISKIAVNYGLLFLLFYFGGIYLSFKYSSQLLPHPKTISTGIFLALLMVYFGQVLTLKPVFILLTQLHLFIRTPYFYNSLNSIPIKT